MPCKELSPKVANLKLLSFNFQEAFETCRDVYGESHHQSLVLLNSLGTVSSLMGMEDQVEINVSFIIVFWEKINY